MQFAVNGPFPMDSPVVPIDGGTAIDAFGGYAIFKRVVPPLKQGAGSSR